MFGFVRSPLATIQVLIPVIGLILFIPGFANLQLPVPYQHTGEGWFYLQWKAMLEWPIFVQVGIGLMCLAVLTILLVNLDQRFQLSGGRTFILSFVILFLASSNGHLFRYHPAMLAACFLSLSYYYLVVLYKTSQPGFTLFNMAFSYGMAVLIYPPLIIVIPAMMLGMLLNVTPVWNNWTLLITGFSAPFLLVWIVFHTLLHQTYVANGFFRWFEIRKEWPAEVVNLSPILILWIAGFILFILIASSSYRNLKNISRQFYLVLVVQFALSLIAALLFQTVSFEIFWIWIIPASFLFTLWIYKMRKGFGRELFFLFFSGLWVYLVVSGILSRS